MQNWKYRLRATSLQKNRWDFVALNNKEERLRN